MKQARKTLKTVLAVVLGVLCLLRADAVGRCDDAAPRAFPDEGWRWLDVPVAAPTTLFDLDSVATRSDVDDVLFPLPYDFFVPFDGGLSFLAPPCEGVLSAALERNVASADDVLDLETLYRGAAISTLAIEPYGKRFYGYGYGAWGDQSVQDANADRPGFNVDSWGGGLGSDWNLFGHGIVGYGLHGAATNVKPRSGGTYKTSINTFAGSVHFSIFDALWRVDASLGWARNWHRQRLLSERRYNIFTTSQWLFDVQFGARFDKGYTRIEPIVNFRALNLTEPKRAEKFLSATSHASDFSDASYRLKLGSRFSWEHEAVLATLKPYLLATWSHEFGSRDIYTIGDSTPFPVAFRHGAHRMARDRLNLGGGLEAAMRRTLDLYFQYDVDFAKDYMAYQFFAGLNKKF